MRHRALPLLLTVTLAAAGCRGELSAVDPSGETVSRLCPSRDAGGLFDWSNLRNPILARPDRMLKDVAVVYNEGWIYLFGSTRFEGDEEDPRPYAFYRTRDLCSWETLTDPVASQAASPDIVKTGDLWTMVFQREEDGALRLYRSTSRDLLSWTEAVPLAPDLHPGDRMIDGALAVAGGELWLGYKHGQQFTVARSEVPELTGRWNRPEDAIAGPRPGFLGRVFGARDSFAENYQFIEIDGEWRMIATGRDPTGPRCIGGTYTCDHEPFIYRRANGSWSEWTDKTHLLVPEEDWNQMMHANSAYLADWRALDGYFYLFYAGSNDAERFKRRGHAKIGVVRSKDLVEWSLPGEL